MKAFSHQGFKGKLAQVLQKKQTHKVSKRVDLVFQRKRGESA